MHASATAHSPQTLRVLTILLVGAHTLFLWMFFSADTVAQMASLGQVPSPAGADVGFIAGRFAAQWKHGMAGNSPLYMPGFFAVGLLTWLWSIGRPLRSLFARWFVILGIALVLAALLAPFGAVHAVDSFERASGLTPAGVAPRPALVTAVVSIFTLFSWTAAIFCAQLSIERRSIKPMALPVALHYVLLVVRPWAINDFTTQWARDVARGLPVAVLSLVAVPVLVTGLVLYQLRRETIEASCQRI